MCVLLCANPIVHEWLDLPLARAYRMTLQLAAVCPSYREGGDATIGFANSNEVVDEPAVAAHAHIMNRSAWIQAYCSRMAKRRGSSPNWHKTLEVFANAWGRLLS